MVAYLYLPVEQLQYDEGLDGEGEQIAGGPVLVMTHHAHQGPHPRVNITVAHHEAPASCLFTRASFGLYTRASFGLYPRASVGLLTRVSVFIRKYDGFLTMSSYFFSVFSSGHLQKTFKFRCYGKYNNKCRRFLGRLFTWKKFGGR